MTIRFCLFAATFAVACLPLSAQRSTIARPGESGEPPVPRAVVVRPAPGRETVGSAAAAAVGIPVAKPAPAPPVAAPAKPEFQLQPSWETQKFARTYTFTIPAPRGQITDRNGVPFAQTCMAQNLAINFPTPPAFTDAEASRYIADQVAVARAILKRPIVVEAEKALKHYRNRGVMPLVITQDLKPSEVELIKRANAPGLTLQQIYQRIYTQGATAGHIIGYVGRQGTYSTGDVEKDEPLWPGSEGRSGLEKTFNEQLTGKPGTLLVTFDAQGRKASEKVIAPPIPGQNVILALDMAMQKAVEKSLIASRRPGAMVLMDPNTGEILAMGSMPGFDPNDFVPTISPEEFDRLSKDPGNPLLPRAFNSAYPPGSTFKVITGLAAMNEGLVDPDDAFGGEAVITIGGTQFHNWKHSDVGPLNFVQALTQSCNTYFYKMGLKEGHKPILEYAALLGLGRKTGIPLGGESPGNLMTTEYMMKTYKRRLMPGDIANLSIGQGDTTVTPLQLASAFGSVGNGGTVFMPRLVLQVQAVDGKITFGYDVRVREQFTIDKDTMKALRDGLIGVVNSPSGTAGVAAMPNVKVAGKTGTAQWGSGKNEKVAAWFAGFAPAEHPKFAFAAVYEGKPGDDTVHGGTYSAPIVARVLKEFLKPTPKEKDDAKKKKKRPRDDDDTAQDDPPPKARVVRHRADDDNQ